MATSRPFAYNPIPPGSEISGTTQFVNLAIGVLNEQYDEDYGGVKWWEGPDEDLGYIICQPMSGNTQPTPISGLTASVGFYRTTAFTDSAFLNLCNALPARKNQTKFQTTNEATVWLTANGYWTNYIAPTPTPTPTVTPTPTSTIPITSTPTTTPTNTPTTTSNRYYYTVGIVNASCTVTSTFIGYSTVSYPIFNFYNDGATKYFISSASYSPTAILLNSLSSSFCIPAVTPTPTPTGTPASTPTPTGTPTPTPTTPPACVTSVSFEVDSAGDVRYVDCCGTTIYVTFGIGPQVINDCLEYGSLFAVGASISFVSYGIESCVCPPTPTPTPTGTPTPTPTPGGANISLFAKTSSVSGGPYYMWYSVDSGSTFTQFATALTTSCVNVGTTPLYPIGTTFIFYMSDTNDPASSGGWPTNATSAGGVCPAITTLCTEGDITTTTSGTLTVWATGNQALPNAC